MRWLCLALLLTGCAPEIRTVTVPAVLHRPARPVLPKVSAAELECVAVDVYQRLYDRQRLITDYAVTLETIIDSTQPEPAHE
ncbi:hypothetical protein [Methylomonas sp. CM2]|uniref:hypothetical protein n=1 Tax=Methylomonas sp. CM2 TaxID=3417647 RepID=UPI003CF9F0E4